MSLNIQLLGMEDLTRQIKRLANVEQITEEALKAGAEYFQEVLESEVYSHGLTERRGKSVESFVMDLRVVNGVINVGISNQDNDAFYLYFHEWGTSKMRARPFMRPAFENHQTYIAQSMAEKIRWWLAQ